MPFPAPKPVRCAIRAAQRRADKRATTIYLWQHPRCEWCGAYSSQVHHIQPKQMGGSRKPESRADSNLVALCLSCHEVAHGLRRSA